MMVTTTGYGIRQWYIVRSKICFVNAV
jgi:hypothetical protein